MGARLAILMIDRYLLGKDWIIMSAPPRVHPRNGETVSVIGAGRVGTALAVALAAAGHEIVAVSTVSNRDRVGRLLPGTPVLPPDEAATGDLVIIAVPDDVLAGLVRGLAAAGAFRPGQLVVHTSGAHGLEPLRPAEQRGTLIAAVHPVMTFTEFDAPASAGAGPRASAASPSLVAPVASLPALLSPGDAGPGAEATRTEDVTFGVTAEKAARRRAAKLVTDLGGIPEWIAERDRTLYHAALAHGANHLVTLVNEARDRLRDAGVDNPERVLRPLLQAALDNSLALGDAALTGPVSRGDAGTVAGHLAALGATAPGSVPPYLALARRTADRAIAAGRLRPADAVPLLEIVQAPRERV
ncbi:Rossmann-like and DUF2520 domain-containing protein [Virgisporangium ochraceum]|uniref:Rossmann-like and DUF2520 domain-containing protein n=1 Tax=Virgisporangium ochraceum TaxID=65505 RepID=UPI0023B32B0D|nr:Rossmann-like and DUF2520 domain-containing protein [Virgisporangium ochraceum]